MAAEIKSATRVLDVLELLSRAGGRMTHGDMAARLDIPKSSLTPLLRSLTGRGYVAEDGRLFSVGGALIAIARLEAARCQIPRLSKDVLDGLVDCTGESGCLSVQRGPEAEVVLAGIGQQRLVANLGLGHRAPLHALSGGRAILANLPADYQTAYFEGRRLDRYTPATVTSLPALRHALETARSEGIAWSIEEYVSGIVGIAAPLCLPSGMPAGALNVSVPTVRFDDRLQSEVIEALRDARSVVEARLSDWFGSQAETIAPQTA